jgi:hypothetical protein
MFCFQIGNRDIGAMRVSNVQVSPLHEQLPAACNRASATQVRQALIVITGSLDMFDPLKSNGNYIYHLLQQSVILHFVFPMILSVKSDYFLKQS